MKKQNPSKKALILISGGIDSPVSAYLLQKQGYELIAIHFSQTPFTDNSPEIKSINACRRLGIKKIIVLQAGPVFQELATKCYHDYYFILMKRMMLRVSEQIANSLNIQFLATGEALAQVSSQTLENLYAIDNATNLQVLRPLITYDKNEIITIARKINTFESSCGEEVCDVLGPKHPRTRCNLQKVLEEEKKLDVNLLAQQIIKSRKEK